jgi:MHS family alpha-ketoglutarate permease-like MFS transporter
MRWSDRIGRRKVMLFFSIGGTVITVPILTLLAETTNVFAAFGMMMLGLVFVSGYTACAAIVKAEMFPTRVRALGVGLPHALVAATFGGTAEPVALALKQGGMESAFFLYFLAPPTQATQKQRRRTTAGGSRRRTS